MAWSDTLVLEAYGGPYILTLPDNRRRSATTVVVCLGAAFFLLWCGVADALDETTVVDLANEVPHHECMIDVQHQTTAITMAPAYRRLLNSRPFIRVMTHTLHRLEFEFRCKSSFLHLETVVSDTSPKEAPATSRAARSSLQIPVRCGIMVLPKHRVQRPREAGLIPY